MLRDAHPDMMTRHDAPAAPIWVLDESASPAAGQAQGIAGQALAIAGRLDLPYLRIPLARRGEPGRLALAAALDGALAGNRTDHRPALVISAGWRAGAQALALRARFGARILHCSRHAHALLPFDLMVRPAARPLAAVPRIIPALGPLGVVSPALLARARTLWRERLDHLPHPRLALLVRSGQGRRLDPAAVRSLGARLAALAMAQGGSIIASVDAAIGAAATAALAETLRPSVHLLYRSDEPGEDPTLGFLAIADAVVVGGASAHALSEAAATAVPVFADPLGDRSSEGRLLLRSLRAQGDIRAFEDGLPSWRRRPLDEAGRVASVLRAMLMA